MPIHNKCQFHIYDMSHELQRNIISYINENIYINSLNLKIFQIIENEYKIFYENTKYNKILTFLNADSINCINCINCINYIDFIDFIDNMELFTKFMTDLFLLLRLSIKYHDNIKTKKLNITYLSNIKNIIRNLSYYIPNLQINNITINKFNILF